MVRRKVCQVALQVDLGVGQLLAVDPDSPLGVSKKGEYQDAKPHLQQTNSKHRKTMPGFPFCAFLPVEAGVLFGVPVSPRPGVAGRLALKAPAPEPPGTNWDRLGWAK